MVLLSKCQHRTFITSTPVGILLPEVMAPQESCKYYGLNELKHSTNLTHLLASSKSFKRLEITLLYYLTFRNNK